MKENKSVNSEIVFREVAQVVPHRRADRAREGHGRGEREVVIRDTPSDPKVGSQNLPTEH